MSRIVIVGGGVIGLFTAYYLSEEGFEVTILDQGDLSNNCSLGNAGMIVPSHIVPLASPGIIEKGLEWMFSSTSPFYIHPKLDLRLIQWCLLFHKAASKKQVERSIPYLKNFGALSKGLYFDLARRHSAAELGLEEKGLLMLYKTREAEHEERAFANLAHDHGLAAEVLTREDVAALEPHAGIDVRGGVFFPGDAHLNPAKLNHFLLAQLENSKVKIERDTEVLDFIFSGKRVERAVTSKGEYHADYFVICAGASSGKIARRLKVNLPMLGGKGYSFMEENSPAVQRPAILVEKRVAVTPFGDKVRFGGTMEITDDHRKINMNRVKGIHAAIASYYSSFQCPLPDRKDVWSGMRPCPPDGLPYIGFTQQWSNVLFGTGHSMMGVSLAPATGMLLTGQLLKRNMPVMTDAFSPDRYRSRLFI